MTQLDPDEQAFLDLGGAEARPADAPGYYSDLGADGLPWPATRRPAHDEYDCCADVVLAIRDEELERLEALHEAHLRVEQRLAREGLESERKGEVLKRAHIALAEQAGKDQAALARVRALAADMRTWCSPHNLAVDYADRIDDALKGPNSPDDDTTPAEEGAADRRYWNGRYDRERS
jgi:hypothetical protein